MKTEKGTKGQKEDAIRKKKKKKKTAESSNWIGLSTRLHMNNLKRRAK